MRNWNEQIRDFLKKHRSEKRYAAVAFFMAVLVAVSVCGSLIKPAISMTGVTAETTEVTDEPIETEETEETYDDGSEMLFETAEEELQTVGEREPLGKIPDGGYDINTMKDTAYFKVDEKSVYSYKDPTPTVSKENIKITGADSAPFEFGITYSGTGAKVSNTDKNGFNEDSTETDITDSSKVNLTLDLKTFLGTNNFDDLTFNKNWGYITDNDYYKAKGEDTAGIFKINDDGTVSVYLTDAYIDYLSQTGSTGSIQGTFKCSGTLNRANTVSGDQTFTYNEESVTVEFPDKEATLTKSDPIAQDDGTLLWTLTIQKEAGLAFDGTYTLDDSLFTSEEEITVVPSEAGAYNNGSFTFNNNDTVTNASTITITYKTPISTANLKEGKISNSANLKKDGKEIDNDQKTKDLSNAITIEKTGETDYKTSGTYGKKIHWKVTIRNPYGLSLNDWTVTDEKLSGAENIEVKSPAGASLGTNGKLSGVPAGTKSVVIEYDQTTGVTEGDNQNTVTVTPPGDDPPSYPGNGTVTYKSEKDLINLTKNGSYDADAHVITWTVVVEATDGLTLNGYELVDEKFTGTWESSSWCTNNQSINSVISYNKDSHKVTVNDNTNIKYLKLVYTQDVEPTDKDYSTTGTAAVTTEVTNSVSVPEKTATQTVVVNYRNTLTKTCAEGNSSTADSNNISKTLNWTADITYDGNFNGKEYVDIVESSGTRTHSHTVQYSSIEVYAGVSSANTKLTNDTDYTVEQTANGFKVQFKDTLDASKYNHVQIKYKTTATATVTFDSSEEGVTKSYDFSNQGSFNGNNTREVTHTISRTNPIGTKWKDWNIGKSWAAGSSSASDYQMPIQVTVWGKKRTESSYQPVKVVRDAYGNITQFLFSGDSDYEASGTEYTVELDSGANWWKSIKVVDSTTDENNVTTYYDYKITETGYYNDDTLVPLSADAQNYKYFTANNNGIYKISEGTNSITNTYYPNITLTLGKTWSGDTLDVTGVKVALYASINGSSTLVPVSEKNGTYVINGRNAQGNQVTDATAVEKELTYTNGSWSTKVLTGLPTAIVNDLKQVQTVKYTLKEIGYKTNGASDYTTVSTSAYYVQTSDGYFQITDPTATNAAGTLNVTNTGHKNISVTPQKSWTGDANGSENFSSITVKLQRKAGTDGEWTDYPNSDSCTKTLTGSGDTWTGEAWTNLPTGSVDANGSLTTYTYRIVETGGTAKSGYTLADGNANRWIVNGTNGTNIGYYNRTDSGTASDSATNNAATLIVTNEYHKTEDTEITIRKDWTNTPTGVAAIRVKLEQNASNATTNKWETYKENDSEKYVVLTGSGDTWTSTVSLPKQTVVNGTVITYKYRVTEIAYKKTGDTDFTTIKNNMFAVDTNGYYTTPTASSEVDTAKLGNSPTMSLTNTYTPSETTNITPKKLWSNDSQYSNNRPAVVQFTLQQRSSTDGGVTWTSWSDYKYEENPAKSTVEVQSNSSTDVTDYAGNTTWTGTAISGLPTKSVSSTEGGVVTVTQYQYQLVETGYKKSEDDGSFTVVSNGEFTYNTVENDSAESVYGKYVSENGTGGNQYVVTNSYAQDTGLTKYALDTSGKKISTLDPTNLEDGTILAMDANGNEKKVNITVKSTTVNGTTYYVDAGNRVYDKDGNYLEGERVDPTYEDLESKEETKRVENYQYDEETGYYYFNWVLEYSMPDELGIDCNTFTSILRRIEDQLPKGHELVTNASAGGEGALTLGNADVIYAKKGEEVSYTTIFDKYTSDKHYFVTPAPIYTNHYGMTWASKRRSGLSEIPEKYDNNNKNDQFYYDAATNTLYFGVPGITENDTHYCVLYSTKVKCSTVDDAVSNAKEEGASYSFTNTAKNGNDKETSATITIKQPSNLLQKSYKATRIPGIVQYTLDINPEGKNLSNGDTIDIQDLFQTVRYTDNCSKGNGATKDGTNLVDVLMNRIRIYSVDVNGTKTELNPSQYTQQFQNGTVSADVDRDGDGTEESTVGAALLKLTVPDETHLSIVYSYKLVANTSTPSVINGCKSTVYEDGIRQTMKPGYVPPAGDEITFSNYAKLSADSASATDDKKDTQYTVSESSGTISTSMLPKITKVNTGDYSIASLNSTFLLAKYDKDANNGAGGWYYAEKVGKATETDKNKVLKWDDTAYSGTEVDAGAAEIAVEDEDYQIELDSDTLYKLVEVSVPSGYAGSDLSLTDAQFKEMLLAYLNDVTTSYQGTDYSRFLSSYRSTNYFVYNHSASMSDLARPDGVEEDAIMQITSGDDIKIPNNQLMDIQVKKSWVGNLTEEQYEAASVKLKLYWSYTKKSSGMPEIGTISKGGTIDSTKAYLADAATLGMTKTLESTKTVSMSELNGETAIWENLPNGLDNGNGNVPIYYYIQETGYTIGGKTYTLQADGTYQTTAGEEETAEKGSYYPIYIGNAANASGTGDENQATITVENTEKLQLKKVWKDANNNEIAASKQPDVIQITSLKGVKADGSGEELLKTAEGATAPTPVTLKKTDGWITNLLTNELTTANLKQYKSFTVTETDAEGVDQETIYTVSCVYNLSGTDSAPVGDITITNKSNKPTSAAVSVSKTWSDGEDLHTDDYITVQLYRSTTKGLDCATIESSSGVEPVTVDKDEKAFANDKLNASNDWSYTWSNLPLEDADGNTYYYYVQEDLNNSKLPGDTLDENGGLVKKNDSAGRNPDGTSKYTATYTLNTQTTGKTKYTITNTKKSIVVKKEWRDGDGALYSNRGSVDMSDWTAMVDVYKKQDAFPANAKIVAFGDSITKGDFNSVEEAKRYPQVLSSKLTTAGYTATVTNKGVNSEQIPAIKSRIANDISNDTDIVLLLGGTNDIHQSGSSVHGDPQGVFERLQTCINDIKTQRPNAMIFVGSIPHFDFFDSNNSLTTGGSWWSWLTDYNSVAGETQANAYIDTYNALIEAAYSGGKVENVQFVDVCSAVDKDTMIVDGCHPNAEGYAAIAEAYYNAMMSYYGSSVKVNSRIVLTKSNNWTKSIDLPANITDSDELYVVETATSADGKSWATTYKVGSGTASTNGADVTVQANSSTPITVVNTEQAVSLALQKTWDGGTSSSITVNLYRSTNQADVPKHLSVTPNPVTITIGSRQQLAVSNVTGSVTYQSSDESIATVDANGLITAVAVGTAEITVTGTSDAFGEEKKTIPVTVTEEPLSVSPESVTLKVGETSELSANRTDVKYTSSNPKIATVDENSGVITAVAKGSATITAESGSETATVLVTVKPAGVITEGVADMTSGGSGGYDQTLDIAKSGYYVSGITFSVTQDANATGYFYYEVNGSGGANIDVTGETPKIYSSWGLGIVSEGSGGTIEVTLTEANNITRLRLMNNGNKAKVKVTYTIVYTPVGEVATSSAKSSTYDNLWDDEGDSSGDTLSMANAVNNVVGAAGETSEATATSTLKPYATLVLNQTGGTIQIDGAAAKEISYTGTNWSYILADLPVYDENGNPYYYWVTETKVGEASLSGSSYTVDYTYKDGNDATTNCISAANPGEGYITICNTKSEDSSLTMPSTGGTGTWRYTATGAALMGISAATVCVRRRRKRE